MFYLKSQIKKFYFFYIVLFKPKNNIKLNINLIYYFFAIINNKKYLSFK